MTAITTAAQSSKNRTEVRMRVVCNGFHLVESLYKLYYASNEMLFFAFAVRRVDRLMKTNSKAMYGVVWAFAVLFVD